MGKNSGIGWTDHTFNPWIGCEEESPGCANCYAKALDKRWGHDRWGRRSPRQLTSISNWKKPLVWDREAEKLGIRYKVFCASMADVFEDNNQLTEWRKNLFRMIQETPNLDWLILTKRPGVAKQFFEVNPVFLMPNIWMGVSAENQKTADERIPILRDIPAAYRFISYEPALEAVDFRPHLDFYWQCACGAKSLLPTDDTTCQCSDVYDEDWTFIGIDWLIVGGESHQNKKKARRFNLEWAEDVLDQCERFPNVYPFVKQLGSNAYYNGVPYPTKDRKGVDWDEWPEHLQVRCFPD